MSFAIWSNLALKKIGGGGPTDGFGVAVTPRTMHLVVVGPYQYTRNPLAFGMWLNYLALSLAMDSIILVVLLILLVPVIKVYIWRFEERRLRADFGLDYDAYRDRVPAFFPRKNRR